MDNQFFQSLLIMSKSLLFLIFSRQRRVMEKTLRQLKEKFEPTMIGGKKNRKDD